MQNLKLEVLNAQVFRVLTDTGEHVGNLKLIGGSWKFKAIGQDAQGQLIPGGGPFTHQHNRVFAAPDEAVVSAALCA